MTVTLWDQARSLLLALGLGICLGLLYDLLRPIRRRTGPVSGTLLDLLFCLLSGAAAFVYAMGSAIGRLGLWELSCTLLAFLLYLHTLSGPVLRLFTAVLDLILKLMGPCKKGIKKTALSAKNSFQKVRKCFIVKR